MKRKAEQHDLKKDDDAKRINERLWELAAEENLEGLEGLVNLLKSSPDYFNAVDWNYKPRYAERRPLNRRSTLAWYAVHFSGEEILDFPGLLDVLMKSSEKWATLDWNVPNGDSCESLAWSTAYYATRTPSKDSNYSQLLKVLLASPTALAKLNWLVRPDPLFDFEEVGSTLVELFAELFCANTQSYVPLINQFNLTCLTQLQEALNTFQSPKQNIVLLSKYVEFLIALAPIMGKLCRLWNFTEWDSFSRLAMIA